MYLACLVITFSGLFSVNLLLEDPSFTSLIMVLTGIGFAVSFISRRQNISPRNVMLPALVVCATLLVMAVMSDPAQSFLAPASVGRDRHKSLAVLITWLTVFHSYVLVSDSNLLFQCVPTIALIGLVGTAMNEPSLLWAFGVFLAAGVFMLIHENGFRATRTLNERSGLRGEAVRLGRQGTIAGLCLVCATVMARPITPVFEAIGSSFRISAGLVPQIRMPNQQPQPNRTRYEERNEFNVAEGPVNLSDTIVMSVRAPESAYWRGATFDQYTGRGWRNTLETLKLLQATEWSEERTVTGRTRLYSFEVPRSTFAGSAGASRRVRQQFEVLTGSFVAVYGAAEPTALRLPQFRAALDESGAVRMDNDIRSGIYEVESDVADWTDESIRAASDDYPALITDTYLQLPSMAAETRQRLQEAARSATSGAASTYDRVKALEAWVGRQCKYNTRAAAAPPDGDVVENFLFNAKEGYCDSFATALAVLCRLNGIPARVATGFLPGTRDEDAQRFNVRERDKHQWVEVYFNNIGWVTFDSTAFAEDISGQAQAAATTQRSLWSRLTSRGWLPPLAVMAALAMLLYVFKVEVWDRHRPRRFAVDALALPANNIRVLAHFETACSLLERKGLTREEHETAPEFLLRVAPLLGDAAPEAALALRELTDATVRFRYSRAEASDTDVADAGASVERIRTALRAAPKTFAPAEAPSVA
jgi:transglutaminase-like putative cysteine protease